MSTGSWVERVALDGNAGTRAGVGYDAQRGRHGRMPGRIIRETRGGGGFGYDCVFVADEHTSPELTSAELDPAEKDRISHRGRALREIAPDVAASLTGRRPPVGS